jgi:NitT/TauT family transport system substrate-binding protein
MQHPPHSTHLAGLLVTAALNLGLMAGTAHAETKDIRVICNNWSGFAPVFVAADLGYFKAMGLNVTVKLDDEQSDALAGLTRGDIEVDMRTVDDYQRRPRSDATPGVMIGTIDESIGGDGVVAAGAIKTPADLKGKTIAMETDIPAYLLMQLELEKAGLSVKDVHIKQTAGSDALSVFADPSIDAIGTFQPFMNQAVKTQAARGAHTLISSASYPGFIIDAIIVNQDKLKADPASYKSFLIGVYKAVAYFDTNQADFLKLAAPHFNLSVADFKASIDGSLNYTSLATAKTYFGSSATPGPIYKTFDTLMHLNSENGASDHQLSAAHSFDLSVLSYITESDLK